MPGDLAQRWQSDIDGLGPTLMADWLQAIRTDACAEFNRSGLPGRKDEHWRYTPLRAFEGRKLVRSSPKAKSDSPGRVFADQAPMQVDMSGGAPVSIRGNAPQGLTVLSLRDGLEQYQDRLRPLVESLDCSGPGRAFAAINTALLDAGLVIHVAENVEAGTLSILWSGSSAAASELHSSRVFMLLDRGARLVLLEQFGGSDQLNDDVAVRSGSGLNLVTQVDLGESASLDHIRLQSETGEATLVTHTRVDQGEQSICSDTGLDLGGGVVRHDLLATLRGSGACARFDGAFVLDGTRHVDNHIVVDHVAKGCLSDQFFRGVLGGRSRGVFNGKALIREGADGSSVRQSNANLLLSPLAEMDTKPELEIYADEVEASHGATVGQLDDSALFYMRSRGIDEGQARMMLTSAFCKSVVDRIDPAVVSRADMESLEQQMFLNMPGPEESGR